MYVLTRKQKGRRENNKIRITQLVQVMMEEKPQPDTDRQEDSVQHEHIEIEEEKGKKKKKSREMELFPKTGPMHHVIIIYQTDLLSLYRCTALRCIAYTNMEKKERKKKRKKEGGKKDIYAFSPVCSTACAAASSDGWLDPRRWNGCDGWKPEKCNTLRTALATPERRFDSGEGGCLSAAAAADGAAVEMSSLARGTVASSWRTMLVGFGGHWPSDFQPCTMALVTSARLIGTVGVRPCTTTLE